MRYWTVFPEDPDIMPQDFESYNEAKDVTKRYTPTNGRRKTG